MIFLSGEVVCQPIFSEQLSEGQRKELEVILDEFADVFKGSQDGLIRSTQFTWRQGLSDRLPTEYLRPTERK